MPEYSRRYGRRSGRAVRELHMPGLDTRFASLVSYYASRAGVSRSVIRRVRAQSLDSCDGRILQCPRRRESGLAIADRCRLRKNIQAGGLARLRIVASYCCFLHRARTACRLRTIVCGLVDEENLVGIGNGERPLQGVTNDGEERGAAGDAHRDRERHDDRDVASLRRLRKPDRTSI